MKEQISNRQLFFTLILLVIPTVIMYVGGIGASMAKQDAWISVQIASLVTVFFVYIIAKLGLRFPNSDFGEICRLLTGKWLGSLIILYYSFWQLYTGSAVLREGGELMSTGVMRQTPLVVFLAMIIILAAIASFLGVEVIARSAEVVLPIIVFFLVTLWLLTLPNVDWANLKPVLADGWSPVIRASLPSIAFRGELFMLIFFLPQMRNKAKANQIGQWSGQFIGILLTINVIIQHVLFGAVEVGRMAIPTLTHAETIEFLGVLERVEIILIAFWIAGITMKVTIFFYVNLLMFSQLFRIKNYRSLIMPTALLYLVFSIVQYETSMDLRNFIAHYFFLFSLPIKFIIPLLLLVIAVIRKKGGNSAEEENSE